MITHMTNTTAAKVGSRLDELRGTAGSGALGRVLTLIILAETEGGVRDALSAAAGASRAHPARIIVLLRAGGKPEAAESGEDQASSRLDAEIRTGSEAGASEIVILRTVGDAGTNAETLVTPLLLPDAPIVSWWIQKAPDNPAATEIGKMAQRRITTSRTADDPLRMLSNLREAYQPGDTDLAWAGITLWRNHIAAMVDEFAHQADTEELITGGVVDGNPNNASTYLMVAWLRLLSGADITLTPGRGSAINSVTLSLRGPGEISLRRSPGSDFAVMHRPGRHDQEVSLPRRSIEAMLIEDLRDLNPDPAYAAVLQSAYFNN